MRWFLCFVAHFCMFFRKIFALFWSQNFRILYIIFAKFLHYSHANDMRKWSKMVEKFFFCDTIFHFCWKPLFGQGWRICCEHFRRIPHDDDFEDFLTILYSESLIWQIWGNSSLFRKCIILIQIKMFVMVFYNTTFKYNTLQF